MCGIYGVFQKNDSLKKSDIISLANSAQVRGIDSAGIVYKSGSDINIKKRDFGSLDLIKETSNYSKSCFIAGHSRLITNDVLSNQPVINENLIVIHNGIITNYMEV